MGQFIVLDLEWNQSPAGKEGSMNRLPFEIIEIGAVKLNKNLQIISEFRRLIRPRSDPGREFSLLQMAAGKYLLYKMRFRQTASVDSRSALCIERL